MLFAGCVSSETCLEAAVTLQVSRAQVPSVLGGKEPSYTSAKCPNFWLGCEVRCLTSLPNTSLSQNHQGGPAVFLLSYSVIAKAGEAKPAHLSASLDQNSAGCPDLMYVPDVQNPGYVQDSSSSQAPEGSNLHLSTAFWMCTRNFQLCDESEGVLLKEISEKAARRSRMRP